MNPEQAQKQEELAQEIDGGEEEKPFITKGKFIAVLVLAGFIDLIIDIPGMIVLFLIFLSIGIKMNTKRVLKIGGCDIIKALPVLNAIPAFTLSALLTMGPLVIKEVEEKVSGPTKGSAAVVQKVLDKKV